MQGCDAVFEIALEELDEPLFILSPGRKLVFANQSFRKLIGANNSAEADLSSLWFWPKVESIELSPGECTTYFNPEADAEIAVRLRLKPLQDGFVLVCVLAGMSGQESSRSFHQQRLQTLGMLAGGVAHDFNNILTGILGHVTYLKASLRLEGQPHESLGSIEDGAKKASDLVQQILNFSKLDSQPKSQNVNLSQLVRRTCRLLSGAISAKYSLDVQTPQEDINVLGGEAKLAQILVNLVVNARDACTNGGSITVNVGEIKDRRKLETILTTEELPCNSYAVLRVEDTGHGMEPEILEKIFEPYFSTKSEKGNGIGLYTVLSIVRSWGGAIEVESAPGHGTAITIYLPQLETSAEHTEEARPTQTDTAGSESILIVDDEYAVRNVLALALQHLGYEVQSAASGLEALEKYKSGTHFDLVVMDMLMPELSGDEAFFGLKRLDPGVKVLLISGFASEDSIQSVLDNGGLGFIQKPFTIDTLAQRVRECLDRR